MFAKKAMSDAVLAARDGGGALAALCARALEDPQPALARGGGAGP